MGDTHFDFEIFFGICGVPPIWGWEILFPANPDLADILGDTDFDFDNFLIFVVPNFWLGTHLGPAWAHPFGFPDAA